MATATAPKVKVGPAILAGVDAHVAAGKTKTEAFELVASEQGKTAQTVATAYYREARKTGAGTVKARPRTKTKADGSTTASATPATGKKRGRPKGTKNAVASEGPGYAIDFGGAEPVVEITTTVVSSNGSGSVGAALAALEATKAQLQSDLAQLVQAMTSVGNAIVAAQNTLNSL